MLIDPVDRCLSEIRAALNYYLDKPADQWDIPGMERVVQGILRRYPTDIGVTVTFKEGVISIHWGRV